MEDIFVLDTGALLSKWAEARRDAQFFTARSVIDELHNRPSKTRAQRLIDTGKLSVQDPLPRHLNEVKTAAAKTGDASVLSETDVQLLALAVWKDEQGFDATIVSSDFALLNTAKSIGLPVEEIGKKMTHKIEWILLCPACGHQRPASGSRNCPVCGTTMKRVPIKREKI
ncbi:MAG: NOB1 family endonuclease [Candidatus Thorarchaeota archaeon]